jgi:WD40 repeat protein
MTAACATSEAPMDGPSDVRPKALQYKPFACLEDKHASSVSISPVLFSPGGSYVACGGEDGKLLIWALLTGKLLHVLTAASAILCLLWLSSDQVVAGMATGVLVLVTIDKVLLFTLPLANCI